MMSQRAGSLSYVTFAAGFSLLAYALFYVACDRWGWRLRLFQTFGTNALAAYILHDLVGEAVSPFVPRDAPGWYLAAGFGALLRHPLVDGQDTGSQSYLPETLKNSDDALREGYGFRTGKARVLL